MKKMFSVCMVIGVLSAMAIPFLVTPTVCEAEERTEVIIRKETKRGSWVDVRIRPKNKNDRVVISGGF